MLPGALFELLLAGIRTYFQRSSLTLATVVDRAGQEGSSHAAIATVTGLKRGVVSTKLPGSTLLIVILFFQEQFSASIKLYKATATLKTFKDSKFQHGHLHQITRGA